VKDTTAPVIQSLTASPSILWPPNKKMIPVTLTVQATDAMGLPSCKLVSITGNDGATANDWLITGLLTARLRAERAGHDRDQNNDRNNGRDPESDHERERDHSRNADRTYTLTVQCTDAAGNSSSATTTVIVPHDRGNDRNN
jgi:hypothetical protein